MGERRGGRAGRAFHALAATQALSILGSRMSGVAIGFAVYAETGKAAPLLLFSFFNELPAMLFGTLAGALVDRGEAKRIVMLADAGQALGSLALALAFLGGGFEPWMLYAVGLWQGAWAAFQGPAKDVLVARLVPDEGRDRANALLSMSFPAAGILAPGLAGALYPLIGVAGVVAVDLATFLAAVSVVAAIALPGRAGTASSAPEREGLFAELRRTAVFLSGRRELALLIVYSAVMNFLLNGPLELALPYALARTGSEEAAGLALSLQGVGGLAGSAFLAALGRSRSRTASIFLGLAGAGLSMIALGTTRSGLTLGILFFAVVACLQVWSRFTSIYQAEVPPERQGTILAFAGQLGFLGSTASFALAGWLADAILEPAARSASWSAAAKPWIAAAPSPIARFLAPLFGSGPGAGMGLLIALAGLLILALTALAALRPGFRKLGVGLGERG